MIADNGMVLCAGGAPIKTLLESGSKPRANVLQADDRYLSHLRNMKMKTTIPARSER